MAKNLIARAAASTAVGIASLAAIGTAHAANTIADPTNDPCAYATVTGAIACVGYYDGNLITGTTGSATTSAEQTYITQLLTGSPTNASPSYSPPYSVDTGTVLGAVTGLNGGTTLDFGSLMLSGFTVLGGHFGQNTAADGTMYNSVTAFWLLDLGSTPTSTLTLTSGTVASSNVQVFGTGGQIPSQSSVPEPSTWVLMLTGFGLAGMALRRRPAVQRRVAFG